MKGSPHPSDQVRQVLDLCARGLNSYEIARRTGLPRSTVYNWSRGRLPQTRDSASRCPDCGGPPHLAPPAPPPPYAYLLGLYLGDGFLTIDRRGATYLCFALDSLYEGILNECRRAITGVLPNRRSHVRPQPGKRCVVIRSYGREWRCLFPQHGPGRKHHRKIELAPWQQKIVGDHAGAFLRGLIHSDGWRGLNKVTAKGRDYAYPRYQFSNRSDDIRQIFCDACDRLGVAWRPWGRWHISVARRDSVVLLDEHVGPKH